MIGDSGGPQELGSVCLVGISLRDFANEAIAYNVSRFV